jgi:hypothetical protein
MESKDGTAFPFIFQRILKFFSALIASMQQLQSQLQENDQVLKV